MAEATPLGFPIPSHDSFPATCAARSGRPPVGGTAVCSGFVAVTGLRVMCVPTSPMPSELQRVTHPLVTIADKTVAGFGPSTWCRPSGDAGGRWDLVHRLGRRPRGCVASRTVNDDVSALSTVFAASSLITPSEPIWVRSSGTAWAGR